MSDFTPDKPGAYWCRIDKTRRWEVAEVLTFADGSLFVWRTGDGSSWEISELQWLGPVTPPDVVAEMREALEPFADEADGWVPDWPDDQPLFSPGQGHAKVTLGDCRRARAVLTKLDGAP